MDITPIPQDANPYRLLQLREGAPRLLVEETYWFLVNRSQRTSNADERELRLHLDELNRAYELVARDGKTATFSPVAPPKRRFGWTKPQAPTPDPYELLCVANDADLDVVQHASRILAALVPQGIDKVQWARMLSEAAMKVTRRGQASTTRAEEDRQKPVVTSDPLASTAPPAERVQASKSARTDAPEGPEAPARADAPVEADARVEAEADQESGGDASNPLMEPANTRARQPSLGARNEREAPVVEADPGPVDRATAIHSLPDTDNQAIVTSSPRDLEPAAPLPSPAETDKKLHAPRVPLLGLVFERRAKQSHLQEQQDSRLLELRGTGETIDEDCAPPHLCTDASAPIRPVTQRVGSHPDDAPCVLRLADLGEHPLERTLGSGPAAARIKIWKQGSRVLLQQVEGSPLAVNDAALGSPLLVLEDGDEISHLGDRLTFQLT